jgi:gas vesicle protein
MSTEKFLIGTISGLVAGIAIGLLAAPVIGDETRQRIADSAENLKKKFKHFTGMAGNELDELSEIFGSEIDGLGDDVRERILKLIEASKAGYKHVKDEALS